MKVLILQHPREPRQPLSTVPLIQEVLGGECCQVRVGLSWPNLKAATGDLQAQSREWVVLYLGSRKNMRGSDPVRMKAILVERQEVFAGAAQTSGTRPRAALTGASAHLIFLDPKGEWLVHPPDLSKFQGLLVLDGTWHQSKTLWWRNSWLLRLQRAFLLPENRSLYHRVRKEPRRECLSTIEAVAYALEALSGEVQIKERLLSVLQAKLLFLALILIPIV